MEQVVIHLSSEDAELFKQFRQWQDAWTLILPCLLDRTVRNVTLHLDEQGYIRKIESNQIRYIK